MSLLKMIDRLIKAGYPEGTAKKIASGELPMDFTSRMNRAREQGFTTEAYHTGNHDILEFDTFGRIGERGGAGSWFSQEPEISASYFEPGSAGYRVLLDTKDYGQVDAGGSLWNDFFEGLEYINRKGEVTPLDEMQDPSRYGYLVDNTNAVGRAAIPQGDKGVEIAQVVDMGPSSVVRKKVITALNKDTDFRAWMNDYEMYGGTNYSVQDPSTIRSYYGAAFDPDNVGIPNILGGAAPVAAGGVLAALGMAPQEAEASSGTMRRASEGIQANPNKGMIGPNAILEALMGFLAPQAMGDGTMDAYNRSRIR